MMMAKSNLAAVAMSKLPVQLLFFAEGVSIEPGNEILSRTCELNVEVEDHKYYSTFVICQLPDGRPMTPFILRANGDFFRPIPISEGRGRLGEDLCRFDSSVIPAEEPGNVFALQTIHLILSRAPEIPSVYDMVWLEERHEAVVRTANFLDIIPRFSNLTMLKPVTANEAGPWALHLKHVSRLLTFGDDGESNYNFPNFCVIGCHQRWNRCILCTVGIPGISGDTPDSDGMFRFSLTMCNDNGNWDGVTRRYLLHDRLVLENAQMVPTGGWNHTLVGGRCLEHTNRVSLASVDYVSAVFSDRIMIEGCPLHISEKIRRLCERYLEYLNDFDEEFGESATSTSIRHEDEPLYDCIYDVLTSEGLETVLLSAPEVPQHYMSTT